jgi:hypothetical protein
MKQHQSALSLFTRLSEKKEKQKRKKRKKLSLPTHLPLSKPNQIITSCNKATHKNLLHHLLPHLHPKTISF